ncbi:MAG: ABC transporter ATP-binding protein [Candidatus Gracilibacteria bacterium]|nr:ABC transporter ATP-binding protein [Candidatus Gracilibacteria bacterium]
MNYKLNIKDNDKKKEPFLESIKRIGPLMSGEKKNLVITLIAVIFSSLSVLIAPVIIASTIDTYIKSKDYNGILINSAILLLVYIVGSYASFVQTKTMGGVGRRILFNLRNTVFTKLQELPVAFFNQNKTGDLISRINSDTEKLNQFISQALMQFLGNFFLIIGSGIFILILDIKLGSATLFPAVLVFIVTQMISPWVKRTNLESLQSTGGMSAEIQESLNNFKVIVAFNRLDYFRNKFEDHNRRNYRASMKAGIASNVFIPLYGLASNLAQLIAISYGIFLITHGNITLGLLIGFQFYVNNFYGPLRMLASIWSSFQLALASLDRISEVLALKSDMKVSKDYSRKETDSILEFNDVFFHYPDGSEVLKNINFKLCKGKTYALVGPTGGGKTTTASLMARLYDPTSGKVLLDKRDIRSYKPSELTKKIGFILQEPFLFTGTVKDNILYGNQDCMNCSDDQIMKLLEKMELTDLLNRFDKGLETEVTASGDSISLGQKQLLAFMRAILRKPEILILDEATANIDTVTEQILEEMLNKLPKDTTKVIIAHRLNTIKNADEIFFVNSGDITSTGTMENALDMLLKGKRES